MNLGEELRHANQVNTEMTSVTKLYIATNEEQRQNDCLLYKANRKDKDKPDSVLYTVFPGDNSGLAPPDPIPNSEVKLASADDSVGFPHVKVGHRQGFILKGSFIAAFFLCF